MSNHEELDDFLQHHGVKGMKWGKVKSHLNKTAKDRKTKRNAKEKVMLDKFHEKHKDTKQYKKVYNSQIKKKKSHISAQRAARNSVIAANINKVKLGVLVVPGAVKAGVGVAGLVGAAASNPNNIRRGKNVIQAIKRSPIRYPSPSDIKNVIN